MYVQVRVYTRDPRAGEIFDHAIEIAGFDSPYAAALHLLGLCSLEELQRLALHELRKIKQLKADDAHAGVEVDDVRIIGPRGEKFQAAL